MLGQALGMHFECEFTWYQHDLVAFWVAWERHRRAILSVNLRGIHMIWWHVWVLGEALETCFDCKYTWYPHDLVEVWVTWKGIGNPVWL